jgi:hypothetical protein
VPRLCEVYPGIYLTTEEKARNDLSQGSRRMPVGKECTEQSILVNKGILVNNIVSASSGGHVVQNVAMGQAFL